MLRFGRLLTALVAAALLISAGSAQAKLFKLQPLSPQDASRLNDKAKVEYEQGLNWVSKIDYPLAFQHFNKAVEAQPENIYLRYVAVQVAVYLGDTRMGNKATEYYDQALNHLKAIDASPALNQRERDRAQGLMDMVGKLKDSVGQRDLNRTKYGRELAKQYAEIIYKKPEETTEQSPEQEALARTGVIKKEGEKSDVATGVDVLTLYKRPRRQTGARPITGAPSTTTEPTEPADTSTDTGAGTGTTTPATK